MRINVVRVVAYCGFGLLIACSSCSAVGNENLLAKLKSLRNTWDSYRESKRIRIEALAKYAIFEPAVGVGQIPSVAATGIVLRGADYSKWAKGLLDVLLAQPLKRANKISEIRVSIEIESPWGGRLLEIGISRDEKCWVIDGTCYRANVEMRRWAKRKLLPGIELIENTFGIGTN